MMNEIRSMSDAIKRFQGVKNSEEFNSTLYELQRYMKRLQLPTECFIELERRAYYMPNAYSEQDTQNKILEAGNRVIEYVKELMGKERGSNDLLKILENFYLFLENLIERKPHGNATIKAQQLTLLKVGNEYDVQHLLYAYLKPLYPKERLEVTEDGGYGAVRPDIYIDSDHVIEIKCTRNTMKEKKLMEEIEADIVHYSARNLYFFIYDKEKLIANPQVFKSNYESITKEKNVYVTIHQPKKI